MWHSFRLLRSRSERTLGIDISSTSVKLLELSRVGEHYCVENYARKTLPEHAMHAGMVIDIDGISQCLRELLKETSFHGKQAIVSIPDSCTIRKIIPVSDRLRNDDLEELVLIEVDKHIPYPIDEINFDFKLLGPSANQTAMRDLLIVASRTEHINHRVEVLRRVGLRTKCVDIESHAILRVLQCVLPTHCKKTIVLIDIGAVRTNVFVIHDMAIIFVHEDAFGGNQQPSTHVSETGPSEDAVLAPFRIQMLSYIKRALQFFYSSHPAHIIDDVVLAGGVAKQADLACFLQDNVHIPTRIINPFETMLFAKQVNQDALMCDAPMFMTACGLALRS